MISYIVATMGRPHLQTTLASIECWPGDEIIVVGNVQTAERGHVRLFAHEPGGDWGSTERNYALPLARGRYVSHMDDDDVYAPGTRARLAGAAISNPHGVTIFRMRLPNGNLLWRDPVIRHGNVGTPMIFHPNDPSKLGRFGEKQDCGDLRFLESMGWKGDDIAFNPEVIAHLGQPHV
jgi:hypothetical protein